MESTTHDVADRRRELLQLLADGDVHSGAVLARRLGVSRTAVWHYARELEALGLSLNAVRGSGYQLDSPIELLDAASIRTALSPGSAAALRGLDVTFVTDSTNQRLVARGSEADRCVAIAEVQTAGRGRRGRRWVGELGHGLCLSLAWQFPGAMQSLAGLSLVAGIAVRQALGALGSLTPGGIDRLRLKWPNDILIDGRKLGGVLVEVSGEMQGPCTAVVGVGINVRLSDAAREAIAAEPAAQAATDVSSLYAVVPSRNRLAAAMIDGLVDVMQRFETSGLGGFIDEWMSLDAMAGQTVVVDTAAGPIGGIARGIDDSGALRVETLAGTRHFHGGEVRVRAGDAAAG